MIAGGAMLLAGCEVRVREPYVAVRPAPVVVEGPAVGAEVDVAGPPPPPQVDVQVAAPGPGFFWIGGAWAWHGRWEWDRGHWDRPPRPGAVWVPHRYAYRNGRHVWVRGHWRR
jgi:hypothetical protein